MVWTVLQDHGASAECFGQYTRAAEWFGRYPGVGRVLWTVSGRSHIGLHAYPGVRRMLWTGLSQNGLHSIRASAEWFAQHLNVCRMVVCSVRACAEWFTHYLNCGRLDFSRLLAKIFPGLLAQPVSGLPVLDFFGVTGGPRCKST